MFSRIFRRGDGFRRLFAQLAHSLGSAVAHPGAGRITGMLIAHLDR